LLVCNLHPKKFGTFERYLIEMGRVCRDRAIRFGLMLSGEPIPMVADELRKVGAVWTAVSDWNDARDRERRGRFLRAYLNVLKSGSWDVVVFQFCTEISVSLASGLARSLGRSPKATIWVQHSQMVMPGRMARWASRMRILRRAIDRMILLSEAGRSAVVARGWPAERTIVVRNGIPLGIEPRRGWLRKELGLPDDAVGLVSIGSLIPREGYDILLPALAPLLSTAQTRHLLILGEGPDRAALAVLVNSLGIASRVHFLGLRNDAGDVLADSDLFVLASRAEGLTLAVVEALAASLPVVVTAVGGHAELVTEDIGIVVPPGEGERFREGVRMLLDDLPKARRMGADGRKRVEQSYSLETQIHEQLSYFATGSGVKP